MVEPFHHSVSELLQELEFVVDRGFDIKKQVLEWAKRIRGVHMPSSVTKKQNDDLGVITKVV